MVPKLHNELALTLPEGFTCRGATIQDLEPAVALFNRWSRAAIGRDEFADLNAVREEWLTPGVDLEEDTRLVFTPEGQLAGYVEVWKTAQPMVHPELWGRVDPDHQDRGIGTWLIQWAEQRARRILPEIPVEQRFAPYVGAYRQVDKAKRLFEDMGYRHIRSFYHMLIQMDAPVPDPNFPAGITLRTFNPETDVEAVYRARTDAFRDHFGFAEPPFEEGLQRFKHRWVNQDVDSTLMFLAMDGDEIAGVSLCRPHAFYDTEVGWVGSLGVRREWRKRGLGLALLRHSFQEFYRRGKRKVGLGVDAQNLTGALRLYENAGMHVDQAFDLYEKELRPGIEISVQSLT